MPKGVTPLPADVRSSVLPTTDETAPLARTGRLKSPDVASLRTSNGAGAPRKQFLVPLPEVHLVKADVLRQVASERLALRTEYTPASLVSAVSSSMRLLGLHQEAVQAAWRTLRVPRD